MKMDKDMEENPFDVHLLAAAWVRSFCLKMLAHAATEMQQHADELREKAAGLE